MLGVSDNTRSALQSFRESRFRHPLELPECIQSVGSSPS